MITADAGKLDREDAMSWPLIGAGLAAMAALYCTRGQFIGLIFLAIALLASRFITWRLPSTRVITWGVRLSILIVVLSMFRTQSSTDQTVWYLNDYDTRIAGYAVAVELVLRAWERPSHDRLKESRGISLLVTGLIFAAATHTFDRSAIQLITPIYMIFILLTLRSFARIGQLRDATRLIRPELAVMRVMIGLVSLTIALLATSLLTRFESQVTAWSSQFINRKHNSSAEIGFSTDARLGVVSNPRPTLDRVLLLDGAPTEQHLRIMAFDTYASPRWLPTIGDRTFESVELKSVASTGPGRETRITRLTDLANLLPMPLQARQIQVQSPVEEDSLASVRGQPDDVSPYEVVVPTAPDFQGTLCVEPNAIERQRLLAIPQEIDSKVVALARQVAGNGASSLKLARIQLHLQGHHAYSLSFNPQGEPLSDFILNDRAAHCQYFASAMVIMARAAGIPARFVDGFYAHEQYGPDQMVVRSRDSHAWAECWIDGIGWTTVDATPATGRPDAIFQDPPAWKQRWEKLTDLPGQIRDWIELHSAIDKRLVAAVLSIVLLIWIIREIWLKRRRPTAIEQGYAPPAEQIVALTRRFETWLAKQRVNCPPQRTWSDHLSSAAMPADSARFVQFYNRARFGADRSALTQAEELLKKLENIG